jgi:uncharacterized protein (DUF342 family)
MSKVELKIAPDDLAVLLSCAVTDPNEIPDTVIEIMEGLQQLGIDSIPAASKVEERLRARVAETPFLRDFPIVEGTPPVSPRHGEVEWMRDFFNSEFVVNEKTGAVDWRRRVGQPTVTEGEILAKLIHPKPGVGGVTVQGRSIPAESPKPARLSAGENVEQQRGEDSDVFVATAPGRVRLVRDKIAVGETLQLPNGVGLATGHVKHNGPVEITGDVEAGSEIVAEGDIDISGHVEPCIIKTEGNLTIHGGVSGDGRRHFQVGGIFQAHWVQEAHLNVLGDVIVRDSILHTVIRSHGAVLIPQGKIVGGETKALAGVVAGTTGSQGRAKTRITAGEDHWLPALLEGIDEDAGPLEEFLDRIESEISPILDQAGSHTPEQAKAIESLMTRKATAEERLQQLRDERQEMIDESGRLRRGMVIVNQVIHRETILRIEGRSQEILEAFVGPIRAVLVGDQIEFEEVKEGDSSEEEEGGGELTRRQ